MKADNLMEFSYLYRDADNYKTFNTIVLEGELSEDQITQMKELLSEGEYFLPIDVGIPPLYPAEPDLDVDHIWHTWGELKSIKKANCIPDMTAQMLFKMFAKTKGHWDEELHNTTLWGLS